MKIDFDTNFFQKQAFDNKTVKRYYQNALKDFFVANKHRQEPDIAFAFCYRALLKICLSLVSFSGHRVKSRQGHHIKLLEKGTEILKNKNIIIIGDKMRKKRNLDLYSGGFLVSTKESDEYLEFVGHVIKEAQQYLKSQNTLF